MGPKELHHLCCCVAITRDLNAIWVRLDVFQCKLLGSQQSKLLMKNSRVRMRLDKWFTMMSIYIIMKFLRLEHALLIKEDEQFSLKQKQQQNLNLTRHFFKYWHQGFISEVKRPKQLPII